jgi:hypothetical protein
MRRHAEGLGNRAAVDIDDEPLRLGFIHHSDDPFIEPAQAANPSVAKCDLLKHEEATKARTLGRLIAYEKTALLRLSCANVSRTS